MSADILPFVSREEQQRLAMIREARAIYESIFPTAEAVVKFNNGIGALLCNGCSKIIATGFNHAPGAHYCPGCSTG